MLMGQILERFRPICEMSVDVTSLKLSIYILLLVQTLNYIF